MAQKCACCGLPTTNELVDRWGGVCSVCDVDIKKGLAKTWADHPDEGTPRKAWGAAIAAQRARRRIGQEHMDSWREITGRPAVSARALVDDIRNERVAWVERQREKARKSRQSREMPGPAASR